MEEKHRSVKDLQADTSKANPGSQKAVPVNAWLACLLEGGLRKFCKKKNFTSFGQPTTRVIHGNARQPRHVIVCCGIHRLD